MNIWLRSILAGGIVCFLLFAAIDRSFNFKPAKLYNVDYRLVVNPSPNEKYSSKAPDVIHVLEKRLDVAGYFYKINDIGKGLIHISILDVKDTAASRSLVTAIGELQFRELYNSSELTSILAAAKEEIRINHQQPTIEFDSVSTDQYENMLHAGTGNLEARDTLLARKLFEKDPSRQLCFGRIADTAKSKKHEQRYRIYFLKTDVKLSTSLNNQDIIHAYIENNSEGRSQVIIEFKHTGVKKWAMLTKENTGRQIAILIDGIVVSAPLILSAVEGNATITGSFTEDEFELISNLVVCPSLPASVQIISATIKPPSRPAKFHLNSWAVLIGFIISSGAAFFLFKTLTPNRKR